MDVYNSLYLTHHYDDENSFWSGAMGVDFVYVHVDLRLPFYFVDSGAHLSGRNFNARNQGELENFSQMVYDQ